MKPITFVTLCMLLIFPALAYGETPVQPSFEDDGMFVYSDVEHFIEAQEAIGKGEDAVEALEKYYFSKASPGLSEYAEIYGLDAERLAARMEEFPSFYASLHDLDVRLRAREGEIREAFEAYLEAVPQARIPPTYYFVGAFQAGGSGGEVGMLISAEIFAADPGVDLSEFDSDRRLYATDRIVHIVTHELAHYTQEEIQGTDAYLSIYGDEKSLLALAIREGSANFMAWLTSGDHINPEAEAYGILHEQELWDIFQQEKHNKETGDWMFYKPKIHTEWPTDLAYWLGFRITQSYYENAEDKDQAIGEILGVTDYDRFLKKSRYGEKF